MKLQTLCLYSTALLYGALGMPTSEQMDKLDAITPPCRKKTGATEETSFDLWLNDWSDDPVKKAYVFCSFKALKLVDENGKFNTEKFKTLAEAAARSKKEADEVYKKCAVERGSPEDSTFEAAKCFHLTLENWSPIL